MCKSFTLWYPKVNISKVSFVLVDITIFNPTTIKNLLNTFVLLKKLLWPEEKGDGPKTNTAH